MLAAERQLHVRIGEAEPEPEPEQEQEPKPTDQTPEEGVPPETK